MKAIVTIVAHRNVKDARETGETHRELARHELDVPKGWTQKGLVVGIPRVDIEKAYSELAGIETGHDAVEVAVEFVEEEA